MLLVTAAILNLTLYSLDVSNCFQSNAIKPEERLWIASPVRYVEWFKLTYPQAKLEPSPSGKYVLQTINGMQGGKDAGRSWYLLLVDIFQDFGLRPCPAEPALFVFYDGQETLALCTSTDDFLCAASGKDIFQRFVDHMKRFVSVTCQAEAMLKYLNVRVIQSEYGVSFDQTHHIQTCILEH